ncbi:MAG: hypothetical protein IV090_26790 [Candidatus Sericytochromatia bacterium]|jgi:uncharacterized membrane protein|nr:hypothetical protein [Candidatus Sericytochromatia bacterium]MBT9549029.1 hypothetical protein [Candidatus Sericytochromatia bacterium]
MLKRIAAFMVLLTMVFAFQSNVWAAAVHAEDTVAPSAEEVIRLSENPQMALLNDNLPVAAATGFGGMKIESWFWILSVIPGLGQFMMGDMWRGILFFIAPILLSVVWSIIAGILVAGAISGGAAGVTGFAAIAPTIGLIVYLASLGLWIWNLVDAYFMNQTKMASIEDQQKMAAELEQKLIAMIKFTEENQVVALDGGFGLNHRVAAF